MIVYYKECPVCWRLLPYNVPLVVRDTDKSQVFRFKGEDLFLVPGDILDLTHIECRK